MMLKKGYSSRICEIMASSGENGLPWDKEQTHESLRMH